MENISYYTYTMKADTVSQHVSAILLAVLLAISVIAFVDVFNILPRTTTPARTIEMTTPAVATGTVQWPADSGWTKGWLTK